MYYVNINDVRHECSKNDEERERDFDRIMSTKKFKKAMSSTTHFGLLNKAEKYLKNNKDWDLVEDLANEFDERVDNSIDSSLNYWTISEYLKSYFNQHLKYDKEIEYVLKWNRKVVRVWDDQVSTEFYFSIDYDPTFLKD